MAVCCSRCCRTFLDNNVSGINVLQVNLAAMDLKVRPYVLSYDRDEPWRSAAPTLVAAIHPGGRG